MPRDGQKEIPMVTKCTQVAGLHLDIQSGEGTCDSSGSMKMGTAFLYTWRLQSLCVLNVRKEGRKVVSENPWAVSQPQPSVGLHFLSEKGISFLVFRVTMAQDNWGNCGTLSPILLRIHGGH